MLLLAIALPAFTLLRGSLLLACGFLDEPGTPILSDL
jgi:hypothetical protein